MHQLQMNASEVAGLIIATLLFIGAICGFLLARWIFRGGLSRYAFSGDLIR